VGLATIEEKPAATNVTTHRYHLSFPLSDGSVTNTATVQDGATQTFQLPVEDSNLTIATFVAKWTDSPPSRLASAATVSIQLMDPTGKQVGGVQSTDGTTGINIPGGPQNEVPAEANISYSSEAKAWDYVLVHYPPTANGKGNWKVTISCTRGGFHPVRAGSVAVDVELGYQFYKADLKEAVKG
jgi:hypothetical protein